tara:strand:- start:268 stop:558 length:291 start_codon:yes stop_codon:yes gene_type:complete
MLDCPNSAAVITFCDSTWNLIVPTTLALSVMTGVKVGLRFLVGVGAGVEALIAVALGVGRGSVALGSGTNSVGVGLLLSDAGVNVGSGSDVGISAG